MQREFRLGTPALKFEDSGSRASGARPLLYTSSSDSETGENDNNGTPTEIEFPPALRSHYYVRDPSCADGHQVQLHITDREAVSISVIPSPTTSSRLGSLASPTAVTPRDLDADLTAFTPISGGPRHERRRPTASPSSFGPMSDRTPPSSRDEAAFCTPALRPLSTGLTPSGGLDHSHRQHPCYSVPAGQSHRRRTASPVHATSPSTGTPSPGSPLYATAPPGKKTRSRIPHHPNRATVDPRPQLPSTLLATTPSLEVGVRSSAGCGRVLDVRGLGRSSGGALPPQAPSQSHVSAQSGTPAHQPFNLSPADERSRGQQSSLGGHQRTSPQVQQHVREDFESLVAKNGYPLGQSSPRKDRITHGACTGDGGSPASGGSVSPAASTATKPEQLPMTLAPPGVTALGQNKAVADGAGLVLGPEAGFTTLAAADLSFASPSAAASLGCQSLLASPSGPLATRVLYDSHAALPSSPSDDDAPSQAAAMPDMVVGPAAEPAASYQPAGAGMAPVEEVALEGTGAEAVHELAAVPAESAVALEEVDGSGRNSTMPAVPVGTDSALCSQESADLPGHVSPLALLGEQDCIAVVEKAAAPFAEPTRARQLEPSSELAAELAQLQQPSPAAAAKVVVMAPFEVSPPFATEFPAMPLVEGVSDVAGYPALETDFNAAGALGQLASPGQRSTQTALETEVKYVPELPCASTVAKREAVPVAEAAPEPASGPEAESLTELRLAATTAACLSGFDPPAVEPAVEASAASAAEALLLLQATPTAWPTAQHFASEPVPEDGMSAAACHGEPADRVEAAASPERYELPTAAKHSELEDLLQAVLSELESHPGTETLAALQSGSSVGSGPECPAASHAGIELQPVVKPASFDLPVNENGAAEAASAMAAGMPTEPCDEASSVPESSEPSLFHLAAREPGQSAVQGRTRAFAFEPPVPEPAFELAQPAPSAVRSPEPIVATAGSFDPAAFGTDVSDPSDEPPSVINADPEPSPFLEMSKPTAVGAASGISLPWPSQPSVLPSARRQITSYAPAPESVLDGTAGTEGLEVGVEVVDDQAASPSSLDEQEVPVPTALLDGLGSLAMEAAASAAVALAVAAASGGAAPPAPKADGSMAASEPAPQLQQGDGQPKSQAGEAQIPWLGESLEPQQSPPSADQQAALLGGQQTPGSHQPSAQVVRQAEAMPATAPRATAQSEAAATPLAASPYRPHPPLSPLSPQFQRLHPSSLPPLPLRRHRSPLPRPETDPRRAVRSDWATADAAAIAGACHFGSGSGPEGHVRMVSGVGVCHDIALGHCGGERAAAVVHVDNTFLEPSATASPRRYGSAGPSPAGLAYRSSCNGTRHQGMPPLARLSAGGAMGSVDDGLAASSTDLFSAWFGPADEVVAMAAAATVAENSGPPTSRDMGRGFHGLGGNPAASQPSRREKQLQFEEGKGGAWRGGPERANSPYRPAAPSPQQQSEARRLLGASTGMLVNPLFSCASDNGDQGLSDDASCFGSPAPFAMGHRGHGLAPGSTCTDLDSGVGTGPNASANGQHGGTEQPGPISDGAAAAPFAAALERAALTAAVLAQHSGVDASCCPSSIGPGSDAGGSPADLYHLPLPSPENLRRMDSTSKSLPCSPLGRPLTSPSGKPSGACSLGPCSGGDGRSNSGAGGITATDGGQLASGVQVLDLTRLRQVLQERRRQSPSGGTDARADTGGTGCSQEAITLDAGSASSITSISNREVAGSVMFAADLSIARAAVVAAADSDALEPVPPQAIAFIAVREPRVGGQTQLDPLVDFPTHIATSEATAEFHGCCDADGIDCTKGIEPVGIESWGGVAAADAACEGGLHDILMSNAETAVREASFVGIASSGIGSFGQALHSAATLWLPPPPSPSSAASEPTPGRTVSNSATRAVSDGAPEAPVARADDLSPAPFGSQAADLQSNSSQPSSPPADVFAESSPQSAGELLQRPSPGWADSPWDGQPELQDELLGHIGEAADGFVGPSPTAPQSSDEEPASPLTSRGLFNTFSDTDTPQPQLHPPWPPACANAAAFDSSPEVPEGLECSRLQLLALASLVGPPGPADSPLGVSPGPLPAYNSLSAYAPSLGNIPSVAAQDASPQMGLISSLQTFTSLAAYVPEELSLQASGTPGADSSYVGTPTSSLHPSSLTPPAVGMLTPDPLSSVAAAGPLELGSLHGYDSPPDASAAETGAPEVADVDLSGFKSVAADSRPLDQLPDASACAGAPGPASSPLQAGDAPVPSSCCLLDQAPATAAADASSQETSPCCPQGCSSRALNSCTQDPAAFASDATVATPALAASCLQAYNSLAAYVPGPDLRPQLSDAPTPDVSALGAPLATYNSVAAYTAAVCETPTAFSTAATGTPEALSTVLTATPEAFSGAVTGANSIESFPFALSAHGSLAACSLEDLSNSPLASVASAMGISPLGPPSPMESSDSAAGGLIPPGDGASSLPERFTMPLEAESPGPAAGLYAAGEALVAPSPTVPSDSPSPLARPQGGVVPDILSAQMQADSLMAALSPLDLASLLTPLGVVVADGSTPPSPLSAAQSGAVLDVFRNFAEACGSPASLSLLEDNASLAALSPLPSDAAFAALSPMVPSRLATAFTPLPSDNILGIFSPLGAPSPLPPGAFVATLSPMVSTGHVSAWGSGSEAAGTGTGTRAFAVVPGVEEAEVSNGNTPGSGVERSPAPEGSTPRSRIPRRRLYTVEQPKAVLEVAAASTAPSYTVVTASAAPVAATPARASAASRVELVVQRDPLPLTTDSPVIHRSIPAPGSVFGEGEGPPCVENSHAAELPAVTHLSVAAGAAAPAMTCVGEQPITQDAAARHAPGDCRTVAAPCGLGEQSKPLKQCATPPRPAPPPLRSPRSTPPGKRLPGPGVSKPVSSRLPSSASAALGGSRVAPSRAAASSNIMRFPSPRLAEKLYGPQQALSFAPPSAPRAPPAWTPGGDSGGVPAVSPLATNTDSKPPSATSGRSGSKLPKAPSFAVTAFAYEEAALCTGAVEVQQEDAVLAQSTSPPPPSPSSALSAASYCSRLPLPPTAVAAATEEERSMQSSPPVSQLARPLSDRPPSPTAAQSLPCSALAGTAHDQACKVTATTTVPPHGSNSAMAELTAPVCVDRTTSASQCSRLPSPLPQPQPVEALLPEPSLAAAHEALHEVAAVQSFPGMPLAPALVEDVLSSPLAPVHTLMHNEVTMAAPGTPGGVTTGLEAACVGSQSVATPCSKASPSPARVRACRSRLPFPAFRRPSSGAIPAEIATGQEAGLLVPMRLEATTPTSARAVGACWLAAEGATQPAAARSPAVNSRISEAEAPMEVKQPQEHCDGADASAAFAYTEPTMFTYPAVLQAKVPASSDAVVSESVASCSWHADTAGETATSSTAAATPTKASPSHGPVLQASPHKKTARDTPSSSDAASLVGKSADNHKTSGTQGGSSGSSSSAYKNGNSASGAGRRASRQSAVLRAVSSAGNTKEMVAAAPTVPPEDAPDAVSPPWPRRARSWLQTILSLVATLALAALALGCLHSSAMPGRNADGLGGSTCAPQALWPTLQCPNAVQCNPQVGSFILLYPSLYTNATCDADWLDAGLSVPDASGPQISAWWDAAVASASSDLPLSLDSGSGPGDVAAVAEVEWPLDPVAWGGEATVLGSDSDVEEEQRSAADDSEADSTMVNHETHSDQAQQDALGDGGVSQPIVAVMAPAASASSQSSWSKERSTTGSPFAALPELADSEQGIASADGPASGGGTCGEDDSAASVRPLPANEARVESVAQAESVPYTQESYMQVADQPEPRSVDMGEKPSPTIPEAVAAASPSSETPSVPEFMGFGPPPPLTLSARLSDVLNGPRPAEDDPAAAAARAPRIVAGCACNRDLVAAQKPVASTGAAICHVAATAVAAAASATPIASVFSGILRWAGVILAVFVGAIACALLWMGSSRPRFLRRQLSPPSIWDVDPVASVPAVATPRRAHLAAAVARDWPGASSAEHAAGPIGFNISGGWGDSALPDRYDAYEPVADPSDPVHASYWFRPSAAAPRSPQRQGRNGSGGGARVSPVRDSPRHSADGGMSVHFLRNRTVVWYNPQEMSPEARRLLRD